MFLCCALSVLTMMPGSLQVRVHRLTKLLKTLVGFGLKVLQDVLKVVFLAEIQLKEGRNPDYPNHT